MKTPATPDYPVSRRFAPLHDGETTIVIGAGPAGLTAAYLLAKQGFRVTVLEGDDIVGGISRTAQYNGYRFDIGGHRFFTKIKPVQEFWDEMLLTEFITVSRLSRILYRGRYFNYPLKPMNAVRGLGIVDTVRVVWSYLDAHFRPNPVEDTFEQWVTNRFGRRLFEIFFKTYTEKVWGLPCSEIRAEWAAQRIQGLSLARAILTATSLNKRMYKSLIDEFRYPRLGPGQMWEECRDRIVASGNDVVMNCRVTGIQCVDGPAPGERRVTGVVASTPSGERVIPANHVVSTMSLRSLVPALDPAPDAAARRAAAGLRYRDFILVALILTVEKLFPDNWIYVHTPGVKVGRIQNFNNWSAAMVPDTRHTCLGMEYFCFEGDALWTGSDAELIAQASRELEVLGIAKLSDVADAKVIRMPKAYPIYDGEYRSHLATIRDFIDPITNLHTVGRNGMHKYNNQDHSMLTAMMAVWNMQGATHDLWRVNTDYEYHEEQRFDAPRHPE
jgi:protoporphyrinogen oxidase